MLPMEKSVTLDFNFNPFQKHAYRYYIAITVLDIKGGIKKNELLKFLSNFNAVSCKVFIFMSY